MPDCYAYPLDAAFYLQFYSLFCGCVVGGRAVTAVEAFMTPAGVLPSYPWPSPLRLRLLLVEHRV